MRRLIVPTLIALFLFQNFPAFANSSLWERVSTKSKLSEPFIAPSQFQVYSLKTNILKAHIWNLSDIPENGEILELPVPDGSFRSFRIWQSPMMEDGLASKYPEIKTYTAKAIDDPSITAKIDFTEYGFHAMIFDGGGTYFIDPYNDNKDGLYICYYKREYARSNAKEMTCLVDNAYSELGTNAIYLTENGLPPLQLKINGASRRTFRLALACTGEYAVKVAGASPTKSAVLAKMVTSMNRVNGVYERELGVHMDLIVNNDALIYLNGSTDPYTNNNGGTMLTENRNNINAVIGSANYDIGHVFSTGGGGIAQLGSVCKTNKAEGVTGAPNPVGDAFDIDYVAHEMGHQFGAEHTFNASTGSCAGNGVSSCAYEPGSGSTIMAYAGICGGGDNIQSNSDDYFHAKSLDQISAFLTSGSGATCATVSSSGNNPPVVAPFTQIYKIPMKTPFELTAPAVTDNDHDKLTYCWEQWNLGDFGQSFSNTRLRGPIFRSFKDTISPTRVFPRLPAAFGEKLPDTSRFLTFKLTVRDIYNGHGTFNLLDDTVHLDVTHTSGPFKVLTPATAVNWTAVTNQTITWDVANTNLAPVSCANVDIFLSVDGGYNYDYTLASNTPNDGSETLFIPNVSNTTNTARIKVKCSNNVFFNVNPINFTVTKSTSSVNEVQWREAVKIYPIPASEMLNIINSFSKPLQVTIVNAVGQKLWQSKLEKYLNIPVNGWGRGVYYLQLTEISSGDNIVRPVLIQ